MVTDPPYGVEYDPSWRNKAGAASTRRTGKVLNDDRADWREAWALFPGDVAYVWHGALHATTVAESLEAAGFAIRSQIIWAKERLVLEPRRLPLAARAVLVRGPQEGRQGPLGRRPQADDALADLQPRPGRRDRPRHPEAGRVHAPADPQQLLARPGGLRAVHGVGHDTDRGRDHRAGLPRRSSSNPAYVDVAVERWQPFTGKTGVLDGSGEAFGALANGRASTMPPPSARSVPGRGSRRLPAPPGPTA